MKIALVAPSPVPFVIGGAENLWTGWIGALNARPGVEADLIKLPTPERNFWEIVDSYRQFAALDLRHFDRVISTKYPAWMVAHPDHHVFLQHKLRGLYDTWPASLATAVTSDAAVVRRLMGVLAAARGARSALVEIFAALDELRAAAAELPAGLFALPGGLIRAVVHGLDGIGLAPGAIRRYAAISATVRARADYFPPGVEVEVIHHPTLPRPAAQPSPKVPSGAIFTASRLDGPKRMDWVLQAYLKADVAAPLVIAGDGPQRAALERLAAGHSGVHLVGRLTDAELAAGYETALFVPFVPDREDYGLITLEALQAGKPVLSCADAGGVTELVRDGDNGLITAPTVAALAQGMRRLANDADLRARLAARARASVAHIQWPVLAEAFSRRVPRLAVVNTFAIYPAVNGGQVRMLQLYRQLAREADVRVVSLSHKDAAPCRRMLAPGLMEVVVPMSWAHAAYETLLAKKLLASCADVAAMRRPALTPDWLTEIEEACRWADGVVACHPYGYPAIRKVWDGPVVYEALNVEADLKAAIFGHAPKYVAAVAAVEAACARQAPVVLCCSAEDAARMQALHGLARTPEVVANGVEAAAYAQLPSAERAALRARLGLGTRPTAVFVGSLHGPNVDALRALMALAPECAEVLFCVVGSVCEAAGLPEAPANVCLVGRVSDAELRVWLAAADVGLNPMVSGSGTNLKMLEYAAAGLPVVSTPFGGRGGILTAPAHYVAAEIAGFATALRALLADERRGEREAMVARAREQARHAGDWGAIAQRMAAAVLGER
ncbi:glycosyltransferase family 4 protein [Aromatoleum aromaticum]|uniref:glycosyltransferase family 4 protein n=1 Tax=Aromatoleum aromaticum TaxID=551760 RepID=UPI002006DEC5|nr:glycosyltransferase family 4 protein [Aromatoleum aromaticum]